jgi:hypothetical protein
MPRRASPRSSASSEVSSTTPLTVLDRPGCRHRPSEQTFGVLPGALNRHTRSNTTHDVQKRDARVVDEGVDRRDEGDPGLGATRVLEASWHYAHNGVARSV